jgi:hypothetical protein
MGAPYGFFAINGHELTTPKSCTYSLMDLSSGQSGRNESTGTNYKDIVAQKRKLVCRWNAIPVNDACVLAQNMKMHGADIQVTYFDIADGKWETRTFCTGDFSCSYLGPWAGQDKFVGDISCDFIEK